MPDIRHSTTSKLSVAYAPTIGRDVGAEPSLQVYEDPSEEAAEPVAGLLAPWPGEGHYRGSQA